MQEFKCSLLREKFTITEKNNDRDNPVIAMSNRIVLHLISADKIDNETFIIRTQNMHSCARLAASIAKEFFERGTLAGRAIPISWQDMWLDVIKGYEKDWNTNIWGVIYHKGRPIFEDGKHHPFLDIIEQCDALNKQEYAKSLEFAEIAFSKVGRSVTIKHDSNIALVASCTEESGRCGIIVRSSESTTTFNFNVSQNLRHAKPIYPHTLITAAAAFLEGIQLAFQVGMMNKKAEFGLVERYSDEDRKHKRTADRLKNLDRAIGMFENQYIVTYRPDRPVLKEMVEKAEKASIKVLKPLLDEKMAGKNDGGNDWVA